MSMCNAYKTSLPPGKTLCVYNDDELIFTADGKWLMPLFELEQFLDSRTGPRINLSAHDTVIGKAAVVLLIRMGISHIHADLASERACEYAGSVNRNCPEHGISFSANSIVPEIACATEKQFAVMDDPDAMYRILRQRANLVRGVPVVAENISSPFGSIRDLSFSLPAGGTLMVVGENGTGKTTLLRHLVGALKPVRGAVSIGGTSVDRLAPRTICYVPQQQNDTVFSLSVDEVVALGVVPIKRKVGDIVSDTLERVDALNLRGRNYASLSGGEKQRVSIARCLAQEAKVLLLDEPTASLDDRSRDMVCDTLGSLSLREMPTILGVSHDPQFIRTLGWNTLRLGREGL